MFEILFNKLSEFIALFLFIHDNQEILERCIDRADTVLESYEWEPFACCGNCIETYCEDFGGACAYAGEIAGWYLCVHYKYFKE